MHQAYRMLLDELESMQRHKADKKRIERMKLLVLSAQQNWMSVATIYPVLRF